MDADLLQELFAVIEDQDLNFHGIVVVRNGYIVAEVYYPPFYQDTPHATYSCTKSFVSALIGIAMEQGLVDKLDQPVLGFFPEYAFNNVDQSKENMTLEHLLSMQSGLVWEDGMPTYIEMGQHNDLIHYVLDRPMADEPGSAFEYCSGCSHLLSIIIQRNSEEGTLAFAQDNLFGPMGITNVIWEQDRSGYPNGGWGLALKPRDMAKFGYLYLNGGVWEEKQIVPAAWVETSTAQRVHVNDDTGYGYQWWVYPSVGMYAARGYKQQAIFVHPGLNLVVAITAEIDDAPNGLLHRMVEQYVVGSVITE
jgi:CubicO group peptidase (beta-lactamase class C family)